MPLPKKRHSKQRGRKRRTHWKIASLNLVVCPQCKQPRPPHTVCKICGYYKGKPSIEIKVKEKKEKKQ